MQKLIVMLVITVSLFTGIASADTFGTGANQFGIGFVTISNNTNPTSGYGIVNYNYRIGIYEITNDQWNKFRAAYGMVTGSPTNAYTSDPYFEGTNVPTSNASWYEAAQFVNWLNTSTGHQAAYKFTGTQGTGDYTLGVWEPGDVGYDASNPYRNSNTLYFLPTEHEWMKAAYWNGTNLQTWANRSDSIPYPSHCNFKYNYNYATDPFGPWNVGSGTAELNGTYDIMGNVWEWMESPSSNGNFLSVANRVVRGGSYYYNESFLWSNNRQSAPPDTVYLAYGIDGIGFRVASVLLPLADAGADQTATDSDDNGSEQVILDGSASSDDYGGIVSWEWSDELGDLIPDGEISTASLSVGTHIITLTVTNDAGFEDTDTVTVIVYPIDRTLSIEVLPDNLSIDTIDPNVGQHVYYSGTLVDLNATRFVECPNVRHFDHWEGDVADPTSAQTTVVVDLNKTVTAVFVDGAICGDECHPNFMEGDFNHDCIIDFSDFAFFASRWLLCTKPECDGSGPVNHPPILDLIDDRSVLEGAEITIAVSATDPDGDALSYEVQNLPAGAVFSEQNFSWTPQPGQAGTYTPTFIVSDGLEQDQETITITVEPDASMDGIVAMWTFDDPTSPGYDDSGNGYNGTVYGAASTPGISSNALSFDGTDDYIDFGNTIGNWGTNDFTLVFWLRSSSTPKTFYISSKREICNQSNFFDLRMEPSGELQVELYNVGNFAQFYSNFAVNDGQWHQVVLMRNGVNIILNIDGYTDRIEIHSIADMINNAPFGVSITPCIGADGTEYFNGDLDEVRIYNRSLTQEEIDSLYQNP